MRLAQESKFRFIKNQNNQKQIKSTQDQDQDTSSRDHYLSSPDQDLR